MKFFAVITCLFSGLFALAANKSEAVSPNRMLKICYISMNNEKEFQLTQSFVEKIQRLAGKNLVTVEEFLEKGSNPEKTLEAMIEKKQICDGLVISGHHTGSFGGGRASGHLSVDFMERVSCEKNKSKWFEAVNSLWLQGCRTLGAPGEVGEQNINMAEFHANRVNAVRQEDGLDQNQQQLAQEFSELLDTQTPYATRFMKSFPQARLYGWTKTAPGNHAGSERSLPFHIHNMAILSGDASTKTKIQDPFDPNMTSEQAEIYLNALIKLLQPPKAGSDIEASLKAWDAHGKPNRKLGLVGFDNDDLASMPPLFGNGDPTLPKSRVLECNLRTGKTERETVFNIDQILADPRYIALTFYTLKDVINRSGEGSSTYRTSIINQMNHNANLLNFLQEKLGSLHSSLVRKLEYYGFLNLVDSKRAFSYAGNLKTKVEEELVKPAKDNDYEQRDFKVKIIEEALKSRLITVKYIREMFERSHDKIFGQSLIQMISQNQLYLPDSKIAELILAVSESNANLGTDILAAIQKVGFWDPRFGAIIEKQIKATELIQYNYSTGLEPILENSFMPEQYINQAAAVIVSKLPVNAELDTQGYQFNLSLSALSVYANAQVKKELRDQALNYFLTTVEKFAANIRPEALNFVSQQLSYNTQFKKLRNTDISKEDKARISQAVIKIFEVRKKSEIQSYEYGSFLSRIYELGDNEELINQEINENIKTRANASRISYFMNSIVEDEKFIKFNVSAVVKSMLAGTEQYEKYQAINILFKAKFEKNEFYDIFNQVLASTGSDMNMTLLFYIGGSKYLSQQTKSYLTQKVLKKYPDILDNELYALYLGFLNPEIRKVNSGTIFEALQKDPNNNIIKVFYAAVWITEHPNLKTIPVQLEPYLKGVDESGVSTMLYILKDRKDVSLDLQTEVVLRLLDLNKFSDEDLGELKKQFRSENGQYKTFKNKDVILKKIDEQLSLIFN